MGPSSLLQVILRLKQNFAVQTTLQASQVQLLYREPGVESGYRPSGQPWSYYLFSVFQLNNETCNIWSHLIAAVIFVVKIFLLRDVLTGSGENWSLVTFEISILLYLTLSVFAHIYHSKSPHWHYFCFQMDYLGIGMYSIGGNVIAVYAGCPDKLYTSIRPYVLALNVPLAWIYVAGCCIAKLRYRRPYPLRRKIIQLVSGIVSILPTISVLLFKLGTCLVDDKCSLNSLSHHGRWIYPFLLSMFFFSSHIPEKLYPGKFDFIGQGHQIFHVVVAAASYLQYEAGRIDLANKGMLHTNLNAHIEFDVFMMFFVYIFGCGAFLRHLKSLVNRRVCEDLKIDSSK